jgi:hypothetical protein
MTRENSEKINAAEQLSQSLATLADTMHSLSQRFTL